MTNAQLNAQREQARLAMERAKSRAKEPTDKNIPDDVEDLIIGDGVRQYKDMRELEKRLDAVMMRKWLDLHELRPQEQPRTRRLRVWISNTVENQPWQTKGFDESMFDFTTGPEGTYKVIIEGKLLEEEDANDDQDGEEEEKDAGKTKGEDNQPDEMDHDSTENPAEQTPAASPPKPRQKMSHFFKSITIEFDRKPGGLQDEGPTYIEWKKPPIPTGATTLPDSASFDRLEFTRKADENINITINLHRDETPERFALSKDLADLLDLEEATRDRVVTGILEYARLFNLQQDEERRLIHCDDQLRAVSSFLIPLHFAYLHRKSLY
jgi:SWI/SNF-related matrix-associated actin-dependent regulator of chromatin subfamily D